ncbi:MAG TPA: phenylalanine--tRNA ligase subunit beta [Chloroflexi bacterium]|nr:phenylalanine--tRNA ligase subunit beta [Chloroflexota bacterium]
MKVPLSWLKEYVDIDIPPQELAKRLTLAGLEVENIEYIGLPGAELPWDPEKIVVGEVRAVRPHPDADRLVLVDVAYGGPELETVVTGAPSLLEHRAERDLHLKVAFAMEGVQLYNGHAEGKELMTLKKAKIRGVPSRAMVCSEKELGLSEEHVDIIYLPDDAPVGVPLADYMGDAILSFDIKGPFAHLQSVFGVAREAAALLDTPLKKDIVQVLDRHPAEVTPTPDFLTLEIADPELCPRYTAAYIKDVAIGPSPFWMQQRLTRAGMRPINNIVDVTNYVMLELGQPLHAFDYHFLQPRPGEDRPAIIVRRAEPGEQMKTLDGVLRTFDEDTLLITDGSGPVAVAGVMGGLDSEVTDETRDILLESANFNFLNVRRTAWMLGLATEASQRFGRRVDPELTIKAAARAAHLMAEIAGGEVVPGPLVRVIGDVYPGQQPRQSIEFDPDHATRILGVEIPNDEIVRILTSLEFQVSKSPVSSSADPVEPETRNLKPETLNVLIPSYRQDITRSIDLVEEIGRIWGYDRFPRTLLKDELPPQRSNWRLEGAERVRDILIGCGVDEVITYSLVDIEDEMNLQPQRAQPAETEHLRLRNPISAERAYLRQTLLPSLLNTTRENLRFLDRVVIFEIGAVYLPVEDQTLPDEPRRLSIVLTGPREPRSWLEGQDRSLMDFYDLKGIAETLLDRLGLAGTFRPGRHPAMHPGRCAEVSVGESIVGVLGELHPIVRENFDLPNQPIGALEFDLDPLLEAWQTTTQIMVPLSIHPPVYEDLAIVVDEGVAAERVRELIEQTGRPLLRSVVLFDVYRGKQIGEGKKSLAYRLTYQADDRTLTDGAVGKQRGKIIRRLEKELGATLRG